MNKLFDQCLPIDSHSTFNFSFHNSVDTKYHIIQNLNLYKTFRHFFSINFIISLLFSISHNSMKLTEGKKNMLKYIYIISFFFITVFKIALFTTANTRILLPLGVRVWECGGGAGKCNTHRETSLRPSRFALISCHRCPRCFRRRTSY